MALPGVTPPMSEPSGIFVGGLIWCPLWMTLPEIGPPMDDPCGHPMDDPFWSSSWKTLLDDRTFMDDTYRGLHMNDAFWGLPRMTLPDVRPPMDDPFWGLSWVTLSAASPG